jgi:4-hydroxymandelate oxidase
MELLRRLEDRARELLPAAVFDYYAGAAGDEVTLAENEEAWRRLWLRPRQLRGVAAADLEVELLGARMAAPVVLAPAASQRLLHPDGELAVARAAARAGLVSCLSTRATADLAEVAAAAPEAPRWFQLYVSDDRELARGQLARAAAHGYGAVILTVDLPVAGRRERELRHGPLSLPEGVAWPPTSARTAWPRASRPWAAGRRSAGRTWAGSPRPRAAAAAQGDRHGEDATRAVRRASAGVVVSNHGGRQLDGCVPTAVALPEVVDAVAGPGRGARGRRASGRAPTSPRRSRSARTPRSSAGRTCGAWPPGGRTAWPPVLAALVADLGALPRPARRARPGELGRTVVSPLGAGKIVPSRRGTRPLAGTSAQSARFAKSPRPDSCVLRGSALPPSAELCFSPGRPR